MFKLNGNLIGIDRSDVFWHSLFAGAKQLMQEERQTQWRMVRSRPDSRKISGRDDR
jgi:hypothetical protein